MAKCNLTITVRVSKWAFLYVRTLNLFIMTAEMMGLDIQIDAEKVSKILCRYFIKVGK